MSAKSNQETCDKLRGHKLKQQKSIAKFGRLAVWDQGAGDPVSGEAVFTVCRQLPSGCVLTWGEREEARSFVFLHVRALISCWGPLQGSSNTTHTQVPSPWGFRLWHMSFGRTYIFSPNRFSWHEFPNFIYTQSCKFSSTVTSPRKSFLTTSALDTVLNLGPQKPLPSISWGFCHHPGLCKPHKKEHWNGSRVRMLLPFSSSYSSS